MKNIKSFLTKYLTHSKFILSICKRGEKDDPNNYRGITLSNCLGKLYNTILHKLLEKDIEKQKILSPTQCGL